MHLGYHEGVDAAAVLRRSRRRAKLSQRELAARAGVPQSTIARIEAGLSDPHLRLFDRLLSACGQELEALPRLGVGVDRSRLRANLELTPAARLAKLSRTARNLAGWPGIAQRQAAATAGQTGLNPSSEDRSR
jgi:transcriptional regulator with XRE-family HTH domain